MRTDTAVRALYQAAGNNGSGLYFYMFEKDVGRETRIYYYRVWIAFLPGIWNTYTRCLLWEPFFVEDSIVQDKWKAVPMVLRCPDEPNIYIYFTANDFHGE